MNFPRGPRSAALVLVLAASLALAACGDDDESDNEAGSDETSVASDTATTEAATTEEAAAAGVSGELTASGIGEIQQGATTDEATAAFGEPAKKQEGPGCELAPNSDRAVAYTYQLGDGTAILVFDVKTQELGNYRVTSPSLATEKGDTVGEPFAQLQSNWGADLKGLPLGAKPTAKAGLWQVTEDADSELLFDIRGGKVTAISGGHVEICE